MLHNIIEFPEKWHVDKKMSRAYKDASPYPHVVVDNFLPEEVIEKLLQHFPEEDASIWQRFNNLREVKKACSDTDALHSDIVDILDSLMDTETIEFLEELTGESPLYPDPYFLGGGLHFIPVGGKLGVHTDFNFHPSLKKTRKLNLLLFLNKDWKDEYGGHLELWNKEMTECEKRIRPVFNRAVIFTIDDTSWHGHHLPLTCPVHAGRKSVALYYYTDGMPEQCHSTIFKDVPEGYDYSLTPII